MAFQPGNRLPVLAGLRREPRTGTRAPKIRCYDDLDRFGFFQDEWLRGGPGPPLGAQRPMPDRPVYVFETGGSTGVPKSRISIDDFRIDYEAFSATLPDDAFPPGVRLADAGAQRPAPPAPGRRAPGAIPRRHLLHDGSGSALGDQADQAREDRRGGGLQAARGGAGPDAAARARQYPLRCSPRRNCSKRCARRYR